MKIISSIKLGLGIGIGFALGVGIIDFLIVLAKILMTFSKVV